MDARSLRVLEFPQVLAEVARHCQWSPGRERIEALEPAHDLDELEQRRQLVGEALRLVGEGIAFGLGGLQDVRAEVALAGRGGVLQPGSLLAIREVAAASRKLARILSQRGEVCPQLADRARFLYTFARLESEIPRCLNPEGRVQDGATPALRELRNEIRELESQIQRNLYNLLHDHEILKLVQEPIVTQRQNRYVIPVKAESKGKFPGIVIDQSGSGVTFFMEPLSVLPLSNRLRAAQLAEEREVEQIIAQLSGYVGQDSEHLLIACDEMAIIDALAAQAHYGFKVQGHLPEVAEKVSLRLVKARHPLLLAHGIDAVPISMELDPHTRTLVLTGPNTGGKTVALKTVGLLTLMAMCGLPIPASSQSAIPWTEAVWADIGDDQSIAQSLSTFSAHLTQILRILPEARSRTLVLLDELGAGTDPVEGAALGVALLESLGRRGALTVVTTHLSEVKVFASKTAGCENAAVEFDATTLSPTFKVQMGIPGRSNALLIAARLGLPDDLLRRARELLGKDQVAVAGLLDDLERERDVVRGLERKLAHEDQELRALREEYQARISKIERERAEILAEAALQAERMVAEARSRSHSLLRDFRQRLDRLERARRAAALAELEAEAQARESEREARENAEPFFEGLSVEELERLTAPVAPQLEGDLAEPEEEEIDPAHLSSETPAPELPEDELDLEGRVAARTLEAEFEQLRGEIRQVAPALPPEPLPEAAPKPASATVAKGSRVYSRRFGQEGEVLALRGDRAEVRLGAVRMTVPLDDLEVVQVAESTVSGIGDLPGGLSERDVSGRVDLRGMTVDEALYELGKRIDQAALARLPKLEIIHGKGTGALRQGVQKFLRSHPQVQDQRLGEVYEGSYGVTVVTLKQ